MKKKVSIMIPCYNEEENIVAITDAVREQMEQLPQYDYEILCIDNCSTDRTRPLLREICAKHPEFLKYWEEGYQIVCGVKTSSREKKFMYRLRTLYYRLIRKFSAVDQIEHFTGFGLYDKSFLDVLRRLDDPTPFIRGIVAELGGKRKEVPYEQPLRRAGKTHNNWYSLYDAAMLSVTSYTKAGMRVAVFGGMITAFVSLLIGFVYLILKLVYWDRFDAGQAPLIIVLSLIGSILLAFMGFLGEYIAAINMRMMHRPLVIEEERINFGPEEERKDS